MLAVPNLQVAIIGQSWCSSVRGGWELDRGRMVVKVHPVWGAASVILMVRTRCPLPNESQKQFRLIVPLPSNWRLRLLLPRALTQLASIETDLVRVDTSISQSA